jgi:hypothetical protein
MEINAFQDARDFWNNWCQRGGTTKKFIQIALPHRQDIYEFLQQHYIIPFDKGNLLIKMFSNICKMTELNCRQIALTSLSLFTYLLQSYTITSQ